MDQKIILDVSSILSSEIGTSQVFSIKEKIKDFDKEVKIVDDLVGKVTINHLQEQQLLSFFDLKTTLEVICARCLKKFKMPLSLEYEQEFSSRLKDDIFPIFGDKTIDIFPSIKQEIFLRIPIKPLCKENCKGMRKNVKC